MIYFDSSFLADYLRGREYTREFITDTPNEAFLTTSVVLFELSFGALKHPSPTETLETVAESLRWVTVEPFDERAAREAATIQDDLRAAGRALSVPDALIAGSVRSAGGTLVTGDRDFERVEDLSVRRLQPE